MLGLPTVCITLKPSLPFWLVFRRETPADTFCGTPTHSVASNSLIRIRAERRLIYLVASCCKDLTELFLVRFRTLQDMESPHCNQFQGRILDTGGSAGISE